MSALESAVSVDLEDDVATIDLFEDGECRLWEDAHGWRGFVRQDGAYFWVDTRDDDWTGRVRCGPGAVRTTIERYLRGEPVAAPAGTVVGP